MIELARKSLTRGRCAGRVDQGTRASGETYERLQTLMRSKALHTVCEEAMCPNIGECWGSGTATFLMLGDVCTRTCGFCDIKHGKPGLLDWGEAETVAQAVKSMK